MSDKKETMLDKIIFLHPTKTGGSSLRKVYGLRMFGRKHSTVEELERMEGKTVEELKAEGYSFLLTVRHPYERVVSMFNFFGYKHQPNFITYLKHIQKNIGRGRRNLIAPQSEYYVEGATVIRFENYEKEVREYFTEVTGEDPGPGTKNVNPTIFKFKNNVLSQEMKDIIYSIYKDDFINFNYEK